MPILQQFGTYVQESFIENEEKDLVFFDQKCIVRGKPVKGDGVVYDLCKGKVTKVWLMKCLDDADDNGDDVKKHKDLSPFSPIKRASNPFSQENGSSTIGATKKQAVKSLVNKGCISKEEKQQEKTDEVDELRKFISAVRITTDHASSPASRTKPLQMKNEEVDTGSRKVMNSRNSQELGQVVKPKVNNKLVLDAQSIQNKISGAKKTISQAVEPVKTTKKSLVLDSQPTEEKTASPQNMNSQAIKPQETKTSLLDAQSIQNKISGAKKTNSQAVKPVKSTKKSLVLDSQPTEEKTASSQDMNSQAIKLQEAKISLLDAQSIQNKISGAKKTNSQAVKPVKTTKKSLVLDSQPTEEKTASPQNMNSQAIKPQETKTSLLDSHSIQNKISGAKKTNSQAVKPVKTTKKSLVLDSQLTEEKPASSQDMNSQAIKPQEAKISLLDSQSNKKKIPPTEDMDLEIWRPVSESPANLNTMQSTQYPDRPMHHLDQNPAGMIYSATCGQSSFQLIQGHSQSDQALLAEPFGNPGSLIHDGSHFQHGAIQNTGHLQLRPVPNMGDLQPVSVPDMGHFPPGPIPNIGYLQHRPVQNMAHFPSGPIPIMGPFPSGHFPNMDHTQPMRSEIPPLVHGATPLNVASCLPYPQLTPETVVELDSLLLGYQPTSVQQSPNQQRVDKKHHLQYQGTVARFIRDKNEEGKAFGFIQSHSIIEKGIGKPSDMVKGGTTLPKTTTDNGERADQKLSDIYFSFHTVQSNLLDLQRGDEVEFRIFVSKKANNAKPKATNVTVVKLSKRKQQMIFDYIDQVKGLLQPESDNIKPDRRYQHRFGRNHFADSDEDEDGNKKTGEEYDPRQTMKLLSSPVVWQCLAEQISLYENSDQLLEKFLEVVLMLHEKIRTLDERFRQVLLHVTSEHKFFNPVRGRFRSYVDQLTNNNRTNNNNIRFFYSDDTDSDEYGFASSRAANYKDQRKMKIFESPRDLVQKFLILVAKMVPEKRSAILALIKPLTKQMHDQEMVEFLFELMKSLTSSGLDTVEDLDWKDLPLILKREEIFNNDLTNAANLKPVKKQGKYSSVEDYVDVYFRLLREDCFYKLKKSIQDLLSGNLDIRDMNVYRNVALVGIAMKDNALFMGLRIASVREIKDWDTCSNLMFGNLVCISISGNFQQPIWATVADRGMLKKDSVVIVQSCWEWNDNDDAEILLNLITAKGDVYMVESPTYYRAFQPILKRLQTLDIENLSFIEELVNLRPGPAPSFLEPQREVTFDASIVYKTWKESKPPADDESPGYLEDSDEDLSLTVQDRMAKMRLEMRRRRIQRQRFQRLQLGSSTGKQKITLQEFFDTPHSPNSVFDPSQEKAVKECLRNRIGIIQGPPGCGKTFIGIQMLRLLLSLSSLKNPKILVLTYKNHALDEFLKGIMRHVDKSKMVRVGGRSKDLELSSISLHRLRWDAQRSAECRDQIQTLSGDIGQIQREIQTSFQKFQHAGQMKLSRFLQILPSSEHKESLMISCPWEKFDLRLNFGVELDEDGFQQQKKKKKKKKGGDVDRITKAKVLEILNSEKTQEKYSENFQKLQYASLRAWLPGQQHFDEFENELIGKRMNIKLKIQDPKEFRKNKAKQQEANGDVDDKGFYELQDEKEIEDEQNERMAALTNSNFKVKSDFNNCLIRVDYKAENQKDSTIKAFSSAALDKIEEMNSGLLNLYDNLWELNLEDRIRFVQMIIAKETRQIRAIFQENLRSYEELCKQKSELENQHTAEVLREKQIIGATITGASINQTLLKEIQPQIIVVEEAAEVLEPQLVAAIGTWTEYMLLIGDHQQLRPPVDTYHLRKDYNFDISMMERLIINKLPFTTLEMQNRQREEFADLLLDIYADLKTNHERVKDNHPAKCLKKSVFFWHHTEAENKERSVTNPEEAKRAVKLALFLIQQGYSPHKVTILAAYRGQTALIRKTMKEYERKYANVINDPNFSDDDDDGDDDDLQDLYVEEKENAVKKSISQAVKIYTVDMYQGDENDFVIVSLVRSNPDKKIGFLSEMNRRCVAQSRARCGVYFIGNSGMFLGHPTWRPLMEKLYETKSVGYELQLVCKEHPGTPFMVGDSEALTLKSFCQSPCGKKMSCGKHDCKDLCQPPHLHDPCTVKFAFTHSDCGHKGTRLCEQEEFEVDCKVSVEFVFKECQHPGKRKCYESEYTMSCFTQVHADLKCGHPVQKQCCQSTNDIVCKEQCARTRPCGHACSDGHTCEEHFKKIALNCADCKAIEEEKMKKQRQEEAEQRKANKERVQEQIKRIQEKDNSEEVKIVELKRTEAALSKYFDIEDAVKNFHSGQNWYPSVTKIEEIQNTASRVKFLKSSLDLFDPDPSPTSVWRFIRMSDSQMTEFQSNNYTLVPKPFRTGDKVILVASRSTSGPQDKKYNQLLICEVFLGKCDSSTIEHVQNAKQLKNLKYDSALVTPVSGNIGDGFNVIYNVHRVFPRYLVSFERIELTTLSAKLSSADADSKSLQFTDDFKTSRKIIKPSRQVNADPFENHFSYVEARFLRMLNKSVRATGSHRITHIEFYINPKLEERFASKEKDFQRRYGSQPEAAAVYGFHGTRADDVVENIMNNNFKCSTSGKFGAGVYFSEQPAYTFGYGGKNHLIMAKILPGRTLECKYSRMNEDLCTPGYDSHGGFKQDDGSFNEVVIFDKDQILPCYVIYFK